MVKIEGVIEDITFYSPETGFCVLILETKAQEGQVLYTTCVGKLPQVQPGEKLILTGFFTEHNIYGKQLSISTYEIIVPTTLEDIQRYLSSGLIYGVGPSTAKTLVEKFGEDTLEILQYKPELVYEIKGIGQKRGEKICNSFHEHIASREIILKLTHFGITTNQALKIYMLYKNESLNVLKTNPYKIIDDITGIGFKIADEIAMKVGIERDSIYRLEAGVKFCLTSGRNQGHVCLPKDILETSAAKVLVCEIQTIDAIIDNMLETGNLKNYEDFIYLPYLYKAEVESAKMLIALDEVGARTEDENIEDYLDEAVKHYDIVLSKEQTQAVTMAIKEPCSIITGGPGTGKTTIIKIAISIFSRLGLKVVLCAPTGRAAKRMAQATGHEAETMHRMLEYGGGGEFLKDEDSPVEADVIIVDEMSMVDINLIHMLVKATPAGAKLIMIGDADQLMSVGPGNVLRELIESECIKTVALKEIYRQEADSLIIANAHKINMGDMPVIKKHSDFEFVEIDSVPDILKSIEKFFNIMKVKLPFDALFNIEVLSPTKKGDLGVVNLNRHIQKLINPSVGNNSEHIMGETVYRVDDKVMQTTNNYQLEWITLAGEKGTGVYNGDIGKIIDIDRPNNEVKVLFDDDKIARYAFSNLEELTHAYCVSVHKSQGSEFDTVILILNGPAPLMTRNLLYTAVTRAKKQLYLLGSKYTLQKMIENNYISKRYTNFCAFLIMDQEQLKKDKI